MALAYAGCDGIPPIERKTVGKMGLKGVPGLNLVASIGGGGGNQNQGRVRSSSLLQHQAHPSKSLGICIWLALYAVMQECPEQKDSLVTHILHASPPNFVAAVGARSRACAVFIYPTVITGNSKP